jgi:putative intracellular protease/amidase
MNVLIVVTSNDQRGATGEKTGFWLEELAAPYYVFHDAGAQITLASPKGGQPPVEPHSQASRFQTDATRRFSGDVAANSALAHTVELASVNPTDFELVFYPGGHGPIWDLVEDKTSITLIESMSADDKPVGAVCHGVAVLRHCKLGGKPLIHGRRVTGFTNTEEAAAGMTHKVPFLVEDVLKESGAQYLRGDDWAAFVVVDGNLVTGQNPASAKGVARELLVLATLGKPILRRRTGV